MALRPVQVNIKALDASAVGRFWAEALGWSVFNPGVTTYVGPVDGRVGATPAHVGQGSVPWTVLADPEGHEFCVLALS